VAEILAHYTAYSPNAEMWSEAPGDRYHAPAHPGSNYTLCGVRTDAPRVGTSRRGWERLDRWSPLESLVDCAKCQKKLQAKKRLGY
jgi:hypothetical protein